MACRHFPLDPGSPAGPLRERRVRCSPRYRGIRRRWPHRRASYASRAIRRPLQTFFWCHPFRLSFRPCGLSFVARGALWRCVVRKLAIEALEFFWISVGPSVSAAITVCTGRDVAPTLNTLFHLHIALPDLALVAGHDLQSCLLLGFLLRRRVDVDRLGLVASLSRSKLEMLVTSPPDDVVAPVLGLVQCFLGVFADIDCVVQNGRDMGGTHGHGSDADRGDLIRLFVELAHSTQCFDLGRRILHVNPSAIAQSAPNSSATGPCVCCHIPNVSDIGSFFLGSQDALGINSEKCIGSTRGNSGCLGFVHAPSVKLVYPQRARLVLERTLMFIIHS
ncbi:unnamed protein product [Penicillium olsonii]|uniref:Uncharacterized protein n=1 Tax=Penicillium olsonii TaxID=99116 RepID=A0A9W4N820_PENOL|nr:unnamed protein product [Penicillium olsonii]CAG8285490.1 unnamed protein product [Penicillium olsonii]